MGVKKSTINKTNNARYVYWSAHYFNQNYNTYLNDLQTRIERTSTESLMDKYRGKIEKMLKNTPIGVEEYINFISSITSKDSILNDVGSAMVNKIGSLPITNKDIETRLSANAINKIDKTKMTKMASALNSSLSSLDTTLSQIESTFSKIFDTHSEGLQAYLRYALMKKTKDPTVSKFLNNLNGDVLKTKVNQRAKIELKQLDSEKKKVITAYGKLQKSLKKIGANQGAVGQTIKSNLISAANQKNHGKKDLAKNEIVQAYANIMGQLQILIGILSQSIAENCVNGEIRDKLSEVFSQAFNIDTGLFKITAKDTGAEKSNSTDGFDIGTDDLSIFFEGTRGGISFKLPVMISLKRINVSPTTKNKRIKVKKSKIGKLLDLMDSSKRNSFYNIYANLNRQSTSIDKKFKNGNNTFPTNPGDIQQIYNSYNREFVLNALAGSLTEDDLSTVFIVNDNAYSMFDIIRKRLDNGEMPFEYGSAVITTAQQKKVANYHSGLYQPQAIGAEYIRSNNIINHINQLDFVAYIATNKI